MVSRVGRWINNMQAGKWSGNDEMEVESLSLARILILVSCRRVFALPLLAFITGVTGGVWFRDMFPESKVAFHGVFPLMILLQSVLAQSILELCRFVNLTETLPYGGPCRQLCS
jgi:hypothetical protein